MPKWFGGSALNPDETVKPGNQWMVQLSRVKRWYDRVQSSKSKSETEPLTAYDFDTLIAFFQNCCHLRDWLESARPELKNDVKILFENSFEMCACRDICHAFKHKDLRKPSLDADFNLYRKDDSFATEVDPRKNPEVDNIAFADGNDIGKFNVFDLVDKCVDLWIDFLHKHGLVRILGTTR
jgi:hypothetical protein